MPVYTQWGVARYLVAYERDPGEELVGEWPLKAISLEELRELFAIAATDPMYDVYAVTEDHVNRLQRCVDHRIDLRARDYFVEAIREDPDGDSHAPPRDLPAFPDARRVRPRTPEV